MRISRKRPRTEPLKLPVLHQSKLRATRSKPHGSSVYTPQPILNPQRPGSGLYASIRKSKSLLINIIKCIYVHGDLFPN